jgi:hypothetical protein
VIEILITGKNLWSKKKSFRDFGKNLWSRKKSFKDLRKKSFWDFLVNLFEMFRPCMRMNDMWSVVFIILVPSLVTHLLTGMKLPLGAPKFWKNVWGWELPRDSTWELPNLSSQETPFGSWTPVSEKNSNSDKANHKKIQIKFFNGNFTPTGSLLGAPTWE